MLDLLRVALERLPLDALQPFADFLGIVDGVFTSIGQAVEAILGSIIERVFQTVEDFAEWVEDFFDAMGSGLVTGDLTAFGTWFEETITQPIVGSIDGFIRGVLGLVGGGFNVNIVEDTARKLASAVDSLNKAVTALETKAAEGGFSGTAVNVDFSSRANASSLGADFAQSYAGTGTGTLGIASGKAAWSGSATDRSGIASYTAKLCTSDYQKIGAAFATLPSTNFLGGQRSYNYLYGRMNPTGTSYVYAEFGANSLQLGCVVDGSPTIFQTNTSFDFEAGSAYWLECGTNGSNARVFRVWKNNQIIMTHTELGAVSRLGTVSSVGHFHAGFGVKSSSSTYVPSKVSAFAFFDNITPATKGSGFRRYRGSGTVSQPSGVNLIPGSFFTTPDLQTEDYTYDHATNKLTVSQAGWYIVQIEATLSTAIIGDKYIQMLLYKNGVAVQAAPELNGPSGSILLAGGVTFGGTFVVYCEAEDYLQPGCASDNAFTLVGGAGGVQTYFQAAFLNNKRPTI
jgi:hypothetical protein